jgi:putative flippase GtrA
MNKEWLRTLKFTLFSISAGIIQVASYAILNALLPFDKLPSLDALLGVEALQNWEDNATWVSYLISLMLSVIWNFTVNRRYTFQSANHVPTAMLKVALFYLILTPASVALYCWLTAGCGWANYLALGLNMLLNFVLEYLYDTYYVFRGSIDTNDRAK